MKINKSILAIISVLVIGIGSVSASPVDAAFSTLAAKTHAKASQNLKHVKVTYDSSKKQAGFTGTAAKEIKKVKVFYNNKLVQTVKVKKSNKFVANAKFTGYKNFTLLGLNKAGKKATNKVTITSQNYAAPKPWISTSNRTQAAMTYEVATNKGCGLNFYYHKQKVCSVSADTEKTTVVFSADELKAKTGSFTIRQTQAGKKSSPAVKAAILDSGQSFATSI
ncbi:hypothetical protein [Lactobacillus sp. ESL0681]|uniref:hypothetical protein n=1 Tax=Lactobacillus sp. ESL0681 TaxID=2983211 RepID=UPI0023F685C2|nr:hypothetical protein [Lactobacillus sp. ESL0681]WEV39776.1 hypothetical protein OZX59_06075 [Lactobacillus sp. ESL0681]